MKKNYLLLLCLICSLCRSFAQTGYVITSKNDTIYCDKVKKPFFPTGSSSARYRIKHSDDFITIEASDIIEYQLSNNPTIYVAELLPDVDKLQFVEMLERGRIDFYKRTTTHTNHFAGMSPGIAPGTPGAGTTTTSSETIYYINKDGSTLTALLTSSLFLSGESRKERKQDFINMISDQPELVAQFKADDSFNSDVVRDYIKRYNAADAKAGKK